MERVDNLQPIKTILEGPNYVFWAQEMCSFLKGRRLWRYCTGEITKPVQQKTEDAANYADRLELWESKNHQILTWIRNTTISPIKSQFGRFETAKEVWDLLSSRYSITDIAHQYQLLDSLRNMKQVKGQSINDFLAHMHSVWDQLALSEPQFETAADITKFCTYRDNLRLMQFIMALHDDYEGVRGSLLHREKFPSLESAVAELLSEETRLGILKPKFEPILPDPVVAASTEITCRYCKRSGHSIKECRKLMAKNKAQQYTRQPQSRFHTSGAVVDSPPTSITLNDLQDFINQISGNTTTTAPVLSATPGSSEWPNSRERA